MVKYGGDKLIQLIYELIKDVWTQEVMPKEWTTTIICPIHKKVIKWIARITEGYHY
jgi:hypothetical protein